jgi:hypothetical protein
MMADSLPSTDTTSESNYDIESASARIGESLFGAQVDSARTETHEEESPADKKPALSPQTPSGTAEQTAVDSLPAPKSWKREMHQYWEKMPKEAQQYYNERERQMLDGMQEFRKIQSVIAPFEPQLSQRGITAYDWIRGLANAEVMLTSGTAEQRRAAYDKLGKQLGLSAPPAEQAQVDPVIKQLQERQEEIEGWLKNQQAAIFNEVRTKAKNQVDAFAADKAHPYFDEVAGEVYALLHSDPEMSLQDAYDRAVWANPVTRAKEQAAALTAHEAKLKESARLNSLPKKKATSVNVRSADVARTPTEPVGSMEDTIREKLREIRTRAS